MKSRNRILIVAFIVIIALLGYFNYIPQTSPYFKGYTKLYTTAGNTSYTIYDAYTKEQKEKGLSGIPHMKKNEGMFFRFDKSAQHGFWMKEMLFPLDFIFVNDNKVVDLLEDIAPTTYPSIITGKEPYNTVIELNAGQIKQSQISIGDYVIVSIE